MRNPRLLFCCSVALISACGSVPLPQQSNLSHTTASVTSKTTLSAAIPVEAQQSSAPSATSSSNSTGKTQDVEAKINAKSSDNEANTRAQAASESPEKDLHAQTSAKSSTPQNNDSDTPESPPLSIKDQNAALDSPLTKIQDNKIVIKTPSTKDEDKSAAKAEQTLASAQATSQQPKPANIDAEKPAHAVKDSQPKKPKKTKKPKQVDVKPTVVSEAEVKYKLASRYYQSNRFQNAIDVLESSDQDTPVFPKSRKLLLNAYVKLARQLMARNELNEAKSLLKKAKILSPEDSRVETELAQVNNILESNKEFKLAMEANNEGKKEAAFLRFKRVLELNPKHREASKFFAKLKETVVSKRHKRALKLFRSQKLNAAIKEWEQLLKLDPSNELAKIYISRAIEMQNRIKNL